MASKYDELRDHLSEHSESTVTLLFTEIDRLIGGLPASARTHRAWWANDPTHSQSAAWLDAGRRTTDVDLNAGRVRFVR